MNKSVIVISVFVLGILAFSCKKEGCTDPTANNYNADAKKEDGSCTFDPDNEYEITMQFTPKYNGETMEAGTIYQDENGNNFYMTRLDFYITEMRATGHSGELVWKAPLPFLFKLDQTQYTFTVTADDNHWHELSFNIGVPENFNTQGGSDAKDITEYEAGHPLGIQVPNMYWSWTSGYIFLSFEGEADTDGDGIPNLDMGYHIGNNDLLTELNVYYHKDIENKNVVINFDVEIDKMLLGVDVSNETLTHSFGSSFPLAEKIKNNFEQTFIYTN